MTTDEMNEYLELRKWLRAELERHRKLEREDAPEQTSAEAGRNNDLKAINARLDLLLQEGERRLKEQQAEGTAWNQLLSDADFAASMAGIDARLDQMARFIAEHITNSCNDGSTRNSDSAHETDLEEKL